MTHSETVLSAARLYQLSPLFRSFIACALGAWLLFAPDVATADDGDEEVATAGYDGGFFIQGDEPKRLRINGRVQSGPELQSSEAPPAIHSRSRAT